MLVIFFTFVWLILRLNGVFTSKYLEKFYNYTNFFFKNQ
jgi:hypothetical protein